MILYIWDRIHYITRKTESGPINMTITILARTITYVDLS